MTWQFYFRSVWLIGGRYFFIAGIAFLIYYIIFRKKMKPVKIQSRFPGPHDYLREIGFSVLTILIFACMPLLLLGNEHIRPHTTFYTHIGMHGWFWFFAAFPVMIILHDTYFYWTHRLMHHKHLFRIFHLLHHRSTNPSPWAAYAFHPMEAVVEAGIFPLFLFAIPIHTLHLFFFFLFMILYNVYGHLGYELYPHGFSRHPIGRWINTSVNHNLHHQHFKGNYGLYFLFWDRIMGTLRPDYEDRFEKVKRSSIPFSPGESL